MKREAVFEWLFRIYVIIWFGFWLSGFFRV
jgi:hypothetical protein